MTNEKNSDQPKLDNLKLQEQQNNPLHGVGLKRLLTEIVEFYGFPILGAQISIQCFQKYPSIESSLKFLKKTPWARNRVEAFYLYKYKQLPLPSEEQHQLEPRERRVALDQVTGKPAIINIGDPEFFDDPVTGPAFPSKARVEKTRATAKTSSKAPAEHKAGADHRDSSTGFKSSTKSGSADPWGKAREKFGE